MDHISYNFYEEDNGKPQYTNQLSLFGKNFEQSYFNNEQNDYQQPDSLYQFQSLSEKKSLEKKPFTELKDDQIQKDFMEGSKRVISKRIKKQKKQKQDKKDKKKDDFFSVDLDELETEPEMIRESKENEVQDKLEKFIFIKKSPKKKNQKIQVFNLNKYFKYRLDQFLKSTAQLYVCNFKDCGKAFNNPSALGGHVSKNHQGQSAAYKNRQQSLKNRKIEKMRNAFYKSNFGQFIIQYLFRFF